MFHHIQICVSDIICLETSWNILKPILGLSLTLSKLTVGTRFHSIVVVRKYDNPKSRGLSSSSSSSHRHRHHRHHHHHHVHVPYQNWKFGPISGQSFWKAAPSIPTTVVRPWCFQFAAPPADNPMGWSRWTPTWGWSLPRDEQPIFEWSISVLSCIPFVTVLRSVATIYNSWGYINLNFADAGPFKNDV